MQYKWMVLTVTTVGVLMSGLDQRIVVVGLPTVAAALHADAEQAIWFTQAYTLGSTVALLFIGRLSDMFGRVKIYAVGFTIFTIGSLLTGLSTAPYMVILARGFQGLGASSLFANSAAIITDAFPANELGLALGVNQIAFRVGAMGGLTLSGLILAFLDWRFLFFVNVPVGIFGTIWAHRRLHEQHQPERRSRMDWVGFASFTASITSFLLALTLDAYGLSERYAVGLLFVIAAGSFAVFIYRERTSKNPLLDLSLLRIREYSGGVVANLLQAIAFGAFILIVSLYLQLVKQYTPLQAGLAIIPFDLAFLAVGPVSGRLSDRYGTAPFTTTGLAVISVSLYLMSTLNAASSYGTLALFLLLQGAGMGMFASPNISSIMGSVPPARRGVASALRATFFNVGVTVSFNVVVLVLTLTVPYAVVTGIISSTGPPATQLQRDLFAQGLQNVYVWLAVINTLAIFPSLLRGARPRLPPQREAEATEEVP